MATRRVPSVRVQMDSKGFSTALASAFFEWLLIFLLFVHAVFSYLLTKFARACTLQTPCLLCSRLDHILGHERPGFCWDLICNAHKLQMSSMVFCSVHDKLVDADGMCETCLVSSAGEKKSHSLGYRLFGDEMDSDDPILNSLNERHCSCCNDLWTPRLDTQKWLNTKSMVATFPEFDSPSPGSSQHNCVNLQDCSKKSRQRTFEAVGIPKLEKHNFSALHHVGYSELKIHSDAESEVTISDDYCDDNCPQKDVFKQDFVFTSTALDSRTIKVEEALSNDLTEEKLIHPMPMPSNLAPNAQLDVYESNYTTSSEAAIGHGLEELNWNQLEQKPTSSVPTELILMHDVASSPEPEQAVGETSGRNIDLSETVEIKQIPILENEKVGKLESGLMAETGKHLKTDQHLNEPVPAIASLLDLNDAYKLAVKNKGAQASSMFAEQITKKDSSKESEDLKLLLSQISSARGLELPLSEMSPRILGQLDELKISEASSPSGIQILQKKISLERNESGLSLDGSNLSEIEGESLVDRLKRQVEYDRKSLSALYKELEEERNAAAVAANQALAMITRLQEEKATLQMEALQYLRMVEEQAEYDMEALQKANDLLAEKEKEVQDLEAEMEMYRTKYPCETVGETVEDQIFDNNGEGLGMECLSADASCGSSAIPSTSSPLDKKMELHNEPEKIDAKNENENTRCSKESLADLGDEKLYISQCLKKLEQKLHLLSNSRTTLDKPSGGYVGKEDNRFNDLENNHNEQSNIGVEESDKYTEEESQNGSRPVDNHQTSSEENHQSLDCINHKKTDLVSLGSEILDLNERLNALEADQNFLEHVMNSLQNSDGVQFIREIALHLRELRGLGIRREEAFLE